MSGYASYIEREFGPARERARRRIHVLVALLVVTALLYGWILVSLVGRSEVTDTAWPIPAEDSVVLASIALAALVALLTLAHHVWSITVNSALSERVQHERLATIVRREERWVGEWKEADDAEVRDARERLVRDLGGNEPERVVGEALLYPRPCGYCGNPMAPLLCQSCNSIQWADLRPEHLGTSMPRWAWSYHAFVSNHRFQLMAALASFTIATLLPLSGSAINRDRQVRRQEQEAAEHASLQFVEATQQWRRSLTAFEAFCEDDLARPGCSAFLADVLSGYYRFSWNGVEVLERTRRTRCRALHEDETLEAACNRLQDPLQDPIEQGDALFREWYRGVASGAPPQERRLAARNLFDSGRVSACIVSVLTWPRELEHARPEDNCSNLLRRGWSPVVELVACPDSMDPMGWGCWR